MLCSNWSTDADLPDSCETTEVEPATLAKAHAYASEVLFNLTKRKYPGSCTDTWHPFACRGCWSRLCACHDAPPWTAALYHGDIVNCANECHLGIDLPGFPVTEITSVTIDGVELDAAAYRLNDRKTLFRIDGSLWPCGCTYDAAENFEIVYDWGRAPTASLKAAAGILAWEFAMAWTPACVSQCRLPARVQTVTRQGITISFDPLSLFTDGFTGIPEVDLLVQAHLRGESHRRATVAIPGRWPSGTRS